MNENKIYLVKNYGNWDGTWSDITAFKNYQDAKDEFEKQVADAIEIYKENCEETSLTIDKGNDSVEIYLTGWYDDNHNIIEIEELELH